MAADEQYPNGDKLAATREDLAEFRGETREQLKTLMATTERIESNVHKYAAAEAKRMDDFEERLAKVERRDWREDDEDATQAKASQIRWQRGSYLVGFAFFLIALIEFFARYHPLATNILRVFGL